MDNAGTYSLRELATKAGVGTSTVSDLIYGRKRTSEATMQAVSDTLRLPAPTIREWAATARGEAKPFRLPPEANRLTKRERDAVLAVVRAMLDSGDEQTEDSPVPDLSRVQGIRLAEETSPTLQAVDTPTDQ